VSPHPALSWEQAADRLVLLPAAVEVDLAAGRVDSAEDAVAEMERIADVYPTTAAQSTVAAARGAIALAEDRPTDALVHLRDAVNGWRELGVPYEAAMVGVRIAEACGLTVALKTSGASGIHIVLPLPPRTSYETSAALALGLAGAVVAADPEHATLERGIKARPKGSIYVDALQNARGKSMAAPYSVRAKPAAPVSAPLRERELTSRLRIETFTVKSMPARLTRTGDVWGDAIATRASARALARAMATLQDVSAASPPRRERTRRSRVGGTHAGPASRRRARHA